MLFTKLIPIGQCFIIINNYTFIINNTVVLFHSFCFNVFLSLCPELS